MSAAADYADFLHGLRLKYFQPREFTSYAERRNGDAENELPPPALWANIVRTAWILDLLRERLARPITLTSIYRGPAYNKAVGGSSRSLHMENNAIDFQVKDVKPEHVFAVLKGWRDRNVFKGGLGLYANFVHVDTRGQNATW